jgi:hypothetical protein
MDGDDGSNRGGTTYPLSVPVSVTGSDDLQPAAIIRRASKIDESANGGVRIMVCIR